MIKDIVESELLNIPALIDGKSPEDTLIVVAMSGGVDSSVVASLLHHLGYKVIGVTLQLFDYGDMEGSNKKTCCAGRDIQDARNVADTMGFPHYVFNYESLFKESVIDDFADSYLKGETPIPCVRCNQSVKFKDLFSVAKDLGADALATGHYIRRSVVNNVSQLHRAIDHKKDQSYFLFSTTQEQLDFLRFPLGDFKKEETRKLAQYFNLTVANKGDSQDICFVGNNSYANIVKKLRPEAIKEGDIVHISTNEVLGKHKGIVGYTIGQRRGLGISSPEPFYVVRIDAKDNKIIVGAKEDLSRDIVYIKELNWLSEEIPAEGSPVEVRLRSLSENEKAIIYKGVNNKARILLDNPTYGVAPGQACVVYSDSRILGGGWIYGSERRAWNGSI